ncbi:probable Zn-dependent protease [Plesiocystis pacifica SIR-1]|uniref:Probable Zn-dependent protease n=1 Tax=Plesiocystis pacifica SIR-1 TaxID=391625 RepID=A6G2S6_9BACT|nr:site-2 protease family protein [Plesiocystis pacifica]EDM79776.1 probable Zn-dependent protease [Plesiocystis pacifica SIR-1]
MFAEPPKSDFDVHFRVGKIPVRVHPLFWLIAMVFGALAVRGSNTHVFVGMALWAAATFVSILVHELGHAIAAKLHGWPPRIVLYSMGGLAIYTPTRMSRRARILIAFAGPGAGFVLGALILVAVLLTGHSVPLPGLPLTIGSGEAFTAGGGRLELFVVFLLYVNIFWGLLNLAPIQPLDGGAIAKAVMDERRPQDAWQMTCKVGVATGAILAVAGFLVWNSTFLAIMFGMLAYNNWQMMQRG